MPFPYGVSEFTTQPWSFEEDVAGYADLGVAAIEVCEVKLDPARADEQLGRVQAAGLTVSSVQATVRTVLPSASQPKPPDRADRLAAFRASVERIAPYAPGAAFVTNTGPAPGGNMAEALDRVVADHKELAAVAADNGVRIALEPLNPVSLNQETAIWTYRQALDVVEAVGRDEVGICLDLWNLWQDPDLVNGVQAAPDRVFLLQASDWRTPRSGMDRRSVGTGEIPTGRLLHAVYDAGYRGPCVVEIFSQGVPDSLYDTDLRELVRANRAGLEQAWQQA
ncbi:sugar phosphate isomerase/epimerase [Georgenia sp. TF02-10]|uniref:sugar phosphate isomerase/epimerase family protein n=1 Tax=Georgenia sp. TF02-10 TaxID=2917725 RepID=UPI001FA76220|nr:sugar phosphate isomerase/epimerase family protein [Georgenia sp. TF02-10]UNX56107.1 sugar phosphate isomerase/epimerase [Georgenia sp. TF02-10]